MILISVVAFVIPTAGGRGRWAVGRTGPHQTRFVLESVVALRARLRGAGADLLLRQGEPVRRHLLWSHGPT
eukprot:SAG11_NODE_396_length_9806_cov_37.601855_8_plen_71_part_00